MDVLRAIPNSFFITLRVMPDAQDDEDEDLMHIIDNWQDPDTRGVLVHVCFVGVVTNIQLLCTPLAVSDDSKKVPYRGRGSSSYKAKEAVERHVLHVHYDVTAAGCENRGYARLVVEGQLAYMAGQSDGTSEASTERV